jgi:hypothetical protein
MKSICFFWSLVFVSIAQAYTPPANFIVNQGLSQREKIKSLEIEGSFSTPNANGLIKETLMLDFVGNRVVALYSNEAGESLGAHALKIQSLSPLGRAWIGVGLDPFGNRVRSALDSLGVSVESGAPVIIARVGTNVVWSWGESSRIKILKDEFLFAGYQSADSEIEVRDYTNKGAAVILPKTVYVKKGDFTYQIKSFKVNAAMKIPTGMTQTRSQLVREWVELVR